MERFYSNEMRIINGMERSSLQDIRFLADHEKLDRVAYCSYPRSGNTFIRNYFEQIAGVYTGGNMGKKVGTRHCTI